MYKAYFRSDPASHSALNRCAFGEADIVDLHSAAIVGPKPGKPHDHKSVQLTVGGMPEHGMPLQHYVAADAEAYDPKAKAGKLVKAAPVAFIESNVGSTNQGRRS